MIQTHKLEYAALCTLI